MGLKTRSRDLLNFIGSVLLVFSLMPCLRAEAQAPTVVRGPYLQTLTPNSAVLCWRTDLATDSEIHYGPSPAQLTSVVTDPQEVLEHQVPVEDLSAATRYYYSIGTSSGVLAGGADDYWFETAPSGNDRPPVQVWVIADSGTADANSQAVRDGYLTASAGIPSDVWLMVGDNAYMSGTDEQYQAAVFDTYPTILRNTPLWPALGNHEIFSSDSPTQTGPFFDAFFLPTAGEAGGIGSGTEAYYSFDHGNVHFICLDSSDTPIVAEGEMLTWLEADLQATTKDWIIAYFHHPPYSKGSHDSDSETLMIEVRELIAPVLEDYGVDLVLSGHSHDYERSYLLDGHYGSSDTFDISSMALDSGDGREDGDGAYVKADGAHHGTIYVVNGTAGNVASSDFGLDHPAMFTGERTLGSMILEIEDSRLDARFINTSGTALDWFTIEKTGVPIFRDNFEYGNLEHWQTAVGEQGP